MVFIYYALENSKTVIFGQFPIHSFFIYSVKSFKIRLECQNIIIL